MTRQQSVLASHTKASCDNLSYYLIRGRWDTSVSTWFRCGVTLDPTANRLYTSDPPLYSDRLNTMDVYSVFAARLGPMSGNSNKTRAVGLLQELGLKEYEAKSFVALTRRESGTAREISDTSDVPRTRVYDAIGVLESKGLVETQHSNPQVFRAVPIEEAVETLKREYVDRTASLRSVLSRLDSTDDTESTTSTHEVWALSGRRAITSRTQRLIEGSTDEVFLIVGHETVITDRLARQLQSAHDRGVDVVINAVDETLEAQIRRDITCGRVSVSPLDWVNGSPLADDGTQISRLLLADRESLVVSSVAGRPPERDHERGVVGRGFDNGVVAIVRRLVASGLVSADAASSSRDE